MPVDALPVPWDTGGSLDGTVPYRREYRDALRRLVKSGTVTIAGQARTERDGVVTVPAPVTVELVGGVLDVHLAPGTYTIAATLRTVDGERTSDSDTVTLTAVGSVT